MRRGTYSTLSPGRRTVRAARWCAHVHVNVVSYLFAIRIYFGQVSGLYATTPVVTLVVALRPHTVCPLAAPVGGRAILYRYVGGSSRVITLGDDHRMKRERSVLPSMPPMAFSTSSSVIVIFSPG